MKNYLEETEIIDFSKTNIQNFSKILAKDCKRGQDHTYTSLEADKSQR